jgi:NADP-dependent 3-hydroxy acid dehydrogenase YdfG
MDDALAELGAHGEVHGLVADVSNQKEIAAAFTTADEIFGGKLDILINNAAVPASSILKTDPADYAHLLGVNLLGYLYCSRYAFDRMHLVKSGHMVNIGSLCADIRDKGADIYVAAKSGVDGFTDSFRKAVASHGIRVTQIHPGVVGTNLITESLEVQQERQHLNEMLKAEDVAEAVLYAVSLPDRVDITEIIIRPHGQSEL